MGLRSMVDFTVLLLLCTQLADIFIRAQEGCKDNVSLENNKKNLKATRFGIQMSKEDCRSWCVRDVTCVSVYAYGRSGCGRSDTPDEELVRHSGATFYKVVFRCPKHFTCNDTACKNGASCKLLGITAVGTECICAGGYTGWFCEESMTCQDNPCKNGATCETTSTGFTCTCPSAWRGRFCENKYSCQYRPCKNGATCVNTTTGFNCECPPLLTGKLCERQYTCQDQPCKNGATCLNSTTGYSCKCPPSRNGVHCESATPEASSQLAIPILGTIGGIVLLAILIPIAIICYGAWAKAKVLKREA